MRRRLLVLRRHIGNQRARIPSRASIQSAARYESDGNSRHVPTNSWSSSDHTARYVRVPLRVIATQSFGSPRASFMPAEIFDDSSHPAARAACFSHRCAAPAAPAPVDRG